MVHDPWSIKSDIKWIMEHGPWIVSQATTLTNGGQLTDAYGHEIVYLSRSRRYEIHHASRGLSMQMSNRTICRNTYSVFLRISASTGNWHVATMSFMIRGRVKFKRAFKLPRTSKQ